MNRQYGADESTSMHAERRYRSRDRHRVRHRVNGSGCGGTATDDFWKGQQLQQQVLPAQQEVAHRSARTRFLESCVQRRIMPMPMLLRTAHEGGKVQLPGYSMGNRAASALLSSLSSLPEVRSLNLRDNRLSSAALAQTVHALPSLLGLRSLDLSENRIGAQGCRLLAAFLGSPAGCGVNGGGLTSLGLSKVKATDKDGALLLQVY